MNYKYAFSDLVELLPSLRLLKTARTVAECGNFTSAARILNRTQSSITKAINELEKKLNCRLLDRTSRGVRVTAQGEALLERVRQAEAEFANAGEIWQKFYAGENKRLVNPVFSMDISHKRLFAFIAVCEAHDIDVAASRLDVTRASINASIREIETQLGISLFENRQGKFTSTAFAETLFIHCKLAFALIHQGIEEIASIEGSMRGQLAIGTLPYCRTRLLPRTIIKILEAYPRLSISTQEGPYDILVNSLINGDLDFIIGAIRHHRASSNLKTEVLLEDKLAIIVRHDHPLTEVADLQLDNLMKYDWILPSKTAPARKIFDDYLSERKISFPAQIIETSSLSTIRGLLLESEKLALLSSDQVYYDEKYGALKTLPIVLENTARPIGITMRRQTTPSPAARLFLDYLRRCVSDLTLDESAH